MPTSPHLPSNRDKVLLAPSLALIPDPATPILKPSASSPASSSVGPELGLNASTPLRPRQESSTLRQTKLAFPVISRGEWLAAEKQKSQRMAGDRANTLERSRLDLRRHIEQKRAYERERKNVYRKRKREEEIVAGTRDSEGKKRKLYMV